MSFIPLVRFLAQSSLIQDLSAQLGSRQWAEVQGLGRIPKGLIASAVAQREQGSLLVITATLEEASRWTAQLEGMGWDTVQFYPTSEASPYEPFDPEPELVWGQFQVLADCLQGKKGVACVATERALQPHLPPPEVFRAFCLRLEVGMELSPKQLGQHLARLGYERVNLVENEGQWSQRGDILDVFPVACEWPVRLEWFGNELEKLREFDPVSQRSQEGIPSIWLTPTGYGSILQPALEAKAEHLSETLQAQLSDPAHPPQGLRRFLGLLYDQPANLLSYLDPSTLILIDEPEQCQAHSQQWLYHAQEQWQLAQAAEPAILPFHRPLDLSPENGIPFARLAVRSFSAPIPNGSNSATFDLKGRAVQAIPHQFGALAKAIREHRKQQLQVWIVSAQPSRAVALLQEHDCPAQYVPNPKDFPALDRQVESHTPVALKYSGLAELEGFILPTLRLVLLTDREFFGQHSLATPTYVRKRRQASSRQVDPNLLQPGDFVVHKAHGIGKFLRLESLTVSNETREYLVIQYSDGLLRVAADQVKALSRYRASSDAPPTLNKMSGSAWEKTKQKVKKSIQKVAFDLLELYAKRAEQTGFAFPPDSPWQQEMEDSFPYPLTPDQIRAVQEVKQDMESPRPMDRLVCGDVGFGKTEVAIRAIFKAVTAGKQVALLAPTTILTQQHYHTLKERFAPYPIQVGLLNRFRSNEEKKEILSRLKSGELDVVVGTHQLLGKDVHFKSLGLLVIDEEQRFGVNQKEKIKALKTQVDVLTLTATPIPRTLYMALSGLREMSLIQTPPPSRRPIKTHLSPYNPEVIRTAICQELDRGGQVFYVVNRIEGIEETSAKLREWVPGARIAIGHGQMPEGELESTMLGFNNGETDILVCTTIVESGLDIPRVNTILIENAQAFGLSQLYQLRGRVGRAGIQAHAWLFYREDGILSEEARKRLQAIQEFTQLGSGYQLAMRDMEIRGIGNLLGTQQSGQLNAVGFDLYLEMLQDAIKEIRGQEIPQVEDTQIDLNVTAMIPQSYIPDGDQKMQAYRQLATASSRVELFQITQEWQDRFGPIPKPTQELLRVMELKLIARSLGFSRIKPAKEHIVLETPMEEPAWNRLKETLPAHLQPRFVYQSGKVTVRGLGMMTPPQQLENLLQWLEKMNLALTRERMEIGIQVAS
ncbi:transcription-repair coupling factor [Thermostichus vulcanus]|uniref:Transcription-repair-coupling factor n=1 Tax=Thermostichus vulcanus str. 'Rupite' TaxID=2813851 RepID=A0ABT0CBI9_THEVL|nr:transcription-repair coupling factor [Thermostichus vulcanus]MCJ2542725.1 transcription-repair coupling factor [Thermostichus vulcanus str. 'Rupite']